MRATILLLLATAAGCASTTDTRTASERESAAEQNFRVAHRAYIQCALTYSEQWVGSDEPASSIADLSLSKCSSAKEDLQFFVHQYNRATWDPGNRGGPLQSMAYEATQKNMVQISDRTRSMVMESVMERRAKLKEEQDND
jgi:hypothetical protein